MNLLCYPSIFIAVASHDHVVKEDLINMELYNGK